MISENPNELKRKILDLSRQYSELMHRANLPAGSADKPEFQSGDSIPYAGRVFDADEVEAAVGSCLDFWLTLGEEGDKFERAFASYLGVKKTISVNSGSSANLLAFAALTSHKLPPEKRIFPGDEVITAGAGFPTTVSPIIQNQAVPVFIDTRPTTGNADCGKLEEAFRPGKTKAVMMAHALGNPFDLESVLRFCRQHDLWLIEDNCDSLGTLYSMPVASASEIGLEHLLRIARKGENPNITLDEAGEVLTAPTGSFGDLSTQSFYPPHHLTMGEGGAVNVVRDMQLKVIVESFRDWGRDCWCPSGIDNTCNKRFCWKLGDLPEGYDHKYIYSHLGYNLKPLDIQAAIGFQQLKKLPDFVLARKQNWEILRKGLDCLSDWIEFTLPTHATSWNGSGFSWDSSGCSADCSWFGFMMIVKEGSPVSRSQLAVALAEAGIGNRMFFGGNLLRQPAFVEVMKQSPQAIRSVGALSGADDLMNNAIFLGTYPGLSREMLDYEISVMKSIFERNTP